jgi:hypothetical protein
MQNPLRRKALKYMLLSAAGVVATAFGLQLISKFPTPKQSNVFEVLAPEAEVDFGNMIIRMRVSNAGGWALGNKTFEDVFDIIETWKVTHLNRFYSCPPVSVDQTIRDGSGKQMTFTDFINESIAKSASPNSPVAISPRLPWDIVNGTQACTSGKFGLGAFKDSAKMIWEFQSQLTPPQTAISIDNAATGTISTSVISSVSDYLISLGFEHISWGASGNMDVASSRESDWAMCLAYDEKTGILLDTNLTEKGNCNLLFLKKQGWYLSYQIQIDYPYELAYFVCNYGAGTCLGCPCLDPTGKPDIEYCDLSKCNGTSTWDGVAGALEQLAASQAAMGYSFVYPLIEGNWDATSLKTSTSGVYGGKTLSEVMYDLSVKYNTSKPPSLLN